METKKINDRFSFENAYRSTQSGFNHTSVLYLHSRAIGIATCQYLNRTWERYTFQTSMVKAVDAAIESEHLKLIDRFKVDFNKSRTTKAEKASLYEKSEFIKELTELRNSL